MWAYEYEQVRFPMTHATTFRVVRETVKEVFDHWAKVNLDWLDNKHSKPRFIRMLKVTQTGSRITWTEAVK